MEYERFELVWFRIKGYPCWPGSVVELRDVPEHDKEVKLTNFSNKLAFNSDKQIHECTWNRLGGLKRRGVGL